MLRALGLMIAFALLSGGSAMAQQPDADMARRTEMAQRLMDVSQGDYLNNLHKLIEGEVLNAMGDLDALPTDEAQWFRVNVPRMGVRMAQEMLMRMTALYAETFTAAELEAQLALYEGPVGRSIANKTMQLGVSQARMMEDMQVRYVQDMLTKLCAEFDCAADPAAAKPTRR